MLLHMKVQYNTITIQSVPTIRWSSFPMFLSTYWRVRNAVYFLNYAIYKVTLLPFHIIKNKLKYILDSHIKKMLAVGNVIFWYTGLSSSVVRPLAFGAKGPGSIPTSLIHSEICFLDLYILFYLVLWHWIGSWAWQPGFNHSAFEFDLVITLGKLYTYNCAIANQAIHPFLVSKWELAIYQRK